MVSAIPVGAATSCRYCRDPTSAFTGGRTHGRGVPAAPLKEVGVALVVQKYGGSSVQDADRIKKVAERIVRTHKEGNDVVVVASAMGDTTDELLDLAEQVSPAPPPRELDMLLTAGERISNALLAMAIHALGVEARSFTGSQAGHGHRRPSTATRGSCRSTRTACARPSTRARSCWSPGFQGVSQDSKDVTTLGRGGSDTTAVALAAALEADVCEIYTDVDGIYSADPRIVPDAQLVDQITYEEMLEMAACGAKVLHLRAVEYARRYNVPLRVRSSYTDKPGSLVTGSIEEIPLENAIITGVAHDRSEAKITVTDVPDTPGMAARIFRTVADADINIDMVLQNISRTPAQRTDITFTLPRVDGAARGRRAHRGAAGDRVRRDPARRRGRQGVAGRGGDAQPSRCHGHLLRGAVRGRHQHRDHEHLGDPDLGDLPRRPARRRRSRPCTTPFELGGAEQAVVHAGTGR